MTAAATGVALAAASLFMLLAPAREEGLQSADLGEVAAAARSATGDEPEAAPNAAAPDAQTAQQQADPQRAAPEATRTPERRRFRRLDLAAAPEAPVISERGLEEALPAPQVERTRIVSHRSASPDLAALPGELRDIVARARQAETRANAIALRARSDEGDGLVRRRVIAQSGYYDGQTGPQGPHGYGRAVWANGDQYAGAWRQGAPHGQGVYRFGDGRLFEGQLANGRPTSQGVFWDAQGERLAGARLFGTLITAQQAP